MDINLYAMTKKFEAMQDLDINSNLLMIQEITKKWYNARPDNKDLIRLRNAVLDLSFIVNKLTYDRTLYHRTISQYRADKDRAIVRARKAEQQLLQQYETNQRTN